MKHFFLKNTSESSQQSTQNGKKDMLSMYNKSKWGKIFIEITAALDIFCFAIDDLGNVRRYVRIRPKLVAATIRNGRAGVDDYVGEFFMFYFSTIFLLRLDFLFFTS